MTTFTVQLYVPNAPKAIHQPATTDWRKAHKDAREHVAANPTHTAAISRNRDGWVETTKWYVGKDAR